MSVRIISGLEYLRRDNPWPAIDYDAIKPEYVSLDAGGRHLVIDLIKEKNIDLMLEIGCFMCGSVRQWLEAVLTLTVIGVDPWDANWGPYLRQMKEHERMSTHLRAVSDVDKFIDNVETYGNYMIALNNVREFRDRFIPVRRFSPEAVEYLSKRDIKPQLAFIDAFKRADELEAVEKFFPECVICGDDWNWRSPDGELGMQKVVIAFAKERGYEIIADRATWILKKK